MRVITKKKPRIITPVEKTLPFFILKQQQQHGKRGESSHIIDSFVSRFFSSSPPFPFSFFLSFFLG
jgi:hypothetical protein